MIQVAENATVFTFLKGTCGPLEPSSTMIFGASGLLARRGNLVNFLPTPGAPVTSVGMSPTPHVWAMRRGLCRGPRHSSLLASARQCPLMQCMGCGSSSPHLLRHQSQERTEDLFLSEAPGKAPS